MKDEDHQSPGRKLPAAGDANAGVAVSLPSLDELLGRVHIVSIPTRTRFRGISVREAAIFEGPNGATEFSPFTEYEDDEAAAWLSATVEYGWGSLPRPLRSQVAINATVPAVSAAEVPDVLARFEGCTTAKVKVAERGQSLSDDIARVRAAREAMGDRALVRIDANGGWAVDEAITALQALAEFDLDYAEQPCMSVPELLEVRRGLPRGHNVRIAADESVRKADDPLAVARSGAADLLIVKAQPLGGMARAMQIIKQAGLPVVVSSALDTSVGIAMGVHLAAALPEANDNSPFGAGVGLAGACGLGTAALLAADVTADPLLTTNGSIKVGRPTLESNLLSEFKASTERERWWRERITRCHQLLTTRARRFS